MQKTLVLLAYYPFAYEIVGGHPARLIKHRENNIAGRGA
jgi:hypothetical protein